MYKTITTFSLIFTVALFLGGCFDSQANEKSAQGAMPPTPVSVVDVNKSDVSLDLAYPARAKSTSSTDINARVQGILLKKYYTEGEFVKAGQLLYLIDPATYEADVRNAKASSALRKAELESAQKEWDRVDALFKEGAVSKKDWDSALSNFESAKASLEAANAELKKAEINLGYTKVTASISGISGQKKQDIGTLVGPGTDNVTLTTVTTLDPMYAEFSMPSSEALILNPDASGGKISYPSDGKVRAVVSDEDGNIITDNGVLDFNDRNVNQNTGSVNARIVFENKNNVIYPGVFIRVALQGLTKKDQLIIPQKAIMQIPTGTFVYTVVEGKAVIKPIKLGKTVGGDMWIVDEGLSQDDKVIADNILKLKPGAPVQIVPTATSQAPKEGSN